MASTTNWSAPEPVPFKINVSDELLSFINNRVATARIPPDLELPQEDAWSYGVPTKTMSHLQEYWKTKYDWRAVEKRINGHLKMFTLPIREGEEELAMHFVWHRSEREGAVPLLFQHGWPGNFLEVDPIIDSLTSPQEGQQAYHVVAPSLPGFVFSAGPKKQEFGLKEMAAVNNKLMLALGYDKYIAQGGDWGSMVARLMGIHHPESCVAVHVNMIVAGPPSIFRYPLHMLYLILWASFQGKDSMFKRMMWWQKEEGGYMEIQGTKPQTISYALVDSPIGMLAWIRDKLQHLVDDDFVWREEDVITWAMLYLIPGTAGHANIYKNAKGKKLDKFQADLMSKVLSTDVDFGVSVFPKDVLNIPRWWAACNVSHNIVFWKEHERGGHFPSVEKPAELVEDIREFTQVINQTRMADLIKSGKLKK